MINIHPSTRVFLCSQAIDMRYSFDGLSGLVKSYFGMNPTCGHLFVFFSRHRDRMKLLFWDSEGFVLYYKRLEHGSFSWLDDLDLSSGGEIEAADFAIILAGVSPTRSASGRKSNKQKPVNKPASPALQLV